jgi:hypothetical protein
MWRVVLLAGLFALLSLGLVAYAGCTTCLTSAFVQRTDTSVRLNFVAQADDVSALPASVNVVVMQVDGQRTKCLTLALPRVSASHGTGVYAGTFQAYGVFTHSGRVDLAGQIYEFSVPLDGKPGTIQLATDQSPLPNRGLTVQVSAAPVTPAPTAAPAPRVPTLPHVDPAFVIGGAVVFVTILGAYVDRRRALARSLAR